MATLDWAPNPADISVHISVIHLFFIIHHLSSSPPIIMPIDLSNLFAEDIAAATAAVEAARRACEERECREVEDQQRWQEEECAHQEVTVQREAEAWKEVEARKAEAEQRLETRQHRKWRWRKNSGSRSQWDSLASNSPSQLLPVSLVWHLVH
jgi:hypothetical protein